MTTNFMDKIIAEVHTKTCIDDITEEVIKDALNEYARMLDDYYAEEYYNALNTARNSAYDSGYDDAYNYGYSAGHSAGHSDGYSDGYDEGYAACKSSLEEDVDNA